MSSNSDISEQSIQSSGSDLNDQSTKQKTVRKKYINNNVSNDTSSYCSTLDPSINDDCSSCNDAEPTKKCRSTVYVHDICPSTWVHSYEDALEFINSESYKTQNINGKNRNCVCNGCNNKALFYYNLTASHKKDITPRLFCEEHTIFIKETYEIKKLNKGRQIKCNVVTCTVCAVYNYNNYSYGLFCIKHKRSTMVDVTSTRCAKEGCTNRGRKRSKTTGKYYCEYDASSDALKPDHILCIYVCPDTDERCTKIKTFGRKRGHPAEYCKRHAPPGYIDVKHKLCKTCDRRANFTERTSRTVEFCSDCKTKTMSDPSKRCIAIKEDFIQCDVQRHYNYPGNKKPEYCKNDAKPGMVVVTNKNCEISGCPGYPSYGLPDSYGTHCETHHKPEQINLDIANRCQIKGCKLIHCCIENNTKKCIEHASPETIAREKKLCQYCNFLKVTTNYICQTCKNDSVRIEHAIVSYLQKHNYDFIHDEQISKSKRLRPDILFDVNGKYVIVEIDENAHDRYTNHQETERMEKIKNLLEANYVEFIRFNPDYIRYNGKNIIVHMKERLKVLRKFIDSVLKNVAEIEEADEYDINVHYLYYPYNDDEEYYNCYQQTRDYKAIKATPRAR